MELTKDLTLKTNLKRYGVFFVLIIAVIVWLRIDSISFVPILERSDINFLHRCFPSELILKEPAMDYCSNLSVEIVHSVSFLGIPTGAVFLSIILGILSVYLFYGFCKELTGSKLSSMFAALLFAGQAPHIVISKFINHEIIALCFFMSFLLLLVKLYNNENNRTILMLAAVLFVLAFLSKYILISFLPLAIVWLYLKNKKTAMIFGGASILLVVGSIFTFNIDLGNVYSTFFKGNEDLHTSFIHSLTVLIQYILVPFALVIAAKNFLYKEVLPTNLLINLLVASSFFGLIALFSQNTVILYKLSVYSVLFVLPIGGLLIKQFFYMPKQYKTSVIFILVASTIFCYYLYKQLESPAKKSYPTELRQ